MSFSPIIQDQDLRAVAKRVAKTHIQDKVPLTDAVIKEASALPDSCTDEHVRRICEMSYHETYEQLHRAASGKDKYISFDPPDVEKAASGLRTQKVAAAHARVRGASDGRYANMAKEASAAEKLRIPKRFSPRDVFGELMLKAAEQPESRIPHSDPMSDIRMALQDLKQKAEELTFKQASARAEADLLFYDLIKHADYACTFEGADLRDILGVAMSRHPLNDDVPETYFAKVAGVVADEMLKRGHSATKEASAQTAPNPEHPVAVVAEKIASALLEQRVATEALRLLDPEIQKLSNALFTSELSRGFSV